MTSDLENIVAHIAVVFSDEFRDDNACIKFAEHLIEMYRHHEYDVDNTVKAIVTNEIFKNGNRNDLIAMIRKAIVTYIVPNKMEIYDTASSEKYTDISDKIYTSTTDTKETTTSNTKETTNSKTGGSSSSSSSDEEEELDKEYEKIYIKMWQKCYTFFDDLSKDFQTDDHDEAAEFLDHILKKYIESGYAKGTINKYVEEEAKKNKLTYYVKKEVTELVDDVIRLADQWIKAYKKENQDEDDHSDFSDEDISKLEIDNKLSWGNYENMRNKKLSVKLLQPPFRYRDCSSWIAIAERQKHYKKYAGSRGSDRFNFSSVNRRKKWYSKRKNGKVHLPYPNNDPIKALRERSLLLVEHNQYYIPVTIDVGVLVKNCNRIVRLLEKNLNILEMMKIVSNDHVEWYAERIKNRIKNMHKELGSFFREIFLKINKKCNEVYQTTEFIGYDDREHMIFDPLKNILEILKITDRFYHGYLMKTYKYSIYSEIMTDYFYIFSPWQWCFHCQTFRLTSELVPYEHKDYKNLHACKLCEKPLYHLGVRWFSFEEAHGYTCIAILKKEQPFNHELADNKSYNDKLIVELDDLWPIIEEYYSAIKSLNLPDSAFERIWDFYLADLGKDEEEKKTEVSQQKSEILPLLSEFDNDFHNQQEYYQSQEQSENLLYYQSGDDGILESDDQLIPII